jgi:hypothetical protein
MRRFNKALAETRQWNNVPRDSIVFQALGAFVEFHSVCGAI